MQTLRTLTRTVAIGAVAVSFAAFGPADARVSEFDSDGDKYVTQEEFHTGTQQSFQSQDADGDGIWSQAEFDARFNNELDDFDDFDADGDGFLSADELNAGMYARYDLDGDGRLDANEAAEFDASVSSYTEPFESGSIVADEDKLNIKANQQ